MNGWILFAVAMASVAAVVGALGFVALTGWRLFKHGRRVAADAMHALEPTLRGADQAAARAAGLAEAGQTLAEHAARLQVAFARLGVLAEATSDGLSPLRKVRDYFK